VFCRFAVNAKRKVGAIQGAILPNGKVPLPAETASATENNRRVTYDGIRVKMWGKSPQLQLATVASGKPYGLKGQIYRNADENLQRAARPSGG